MKTLIAGVGNIFFGDDGFGSEVVKQLAERPLGDDVRVRDFGIRGMHLALEMLEPYDRIVLVDAIGREDAAGTLYLIQASTSSAAVRQAHDDSVAAVRHAYDDSADPHAMTIESVLALYERLKMDMAPAHAPEIFIVGCVPQTTNEGMELSEPVRAALPRCVQLIEDLVCERKLSREPLQSQLHCTLPNSP